MSDEFDELLVETGIRFTPQAGFSPFPVRNCRFRYHRAYRHASGVEVRFRIDSLLRFKASGTLPANFSDSAFITGIANLSGGKAGVREWEKDKVREFFNADWVRAAYFTPVDPEFAPDHELAVVHYFHRTQIADVYLIGLYRKGDEKAEGLILGNEPPVRYPDFPEAEPAKPAAAAQAAPAHGEAFIELWRKATTLIDGAINLDGRRLPAPTDAEKRRLSEAIPLLERAAALEPGNAGPDLFIGKIHERLGDLRASLAALRRGHAIAPDNSTLILELGGTLGRCGLHDDAVAVLSMGASIHPRHPVIQYNLGVSLLMSGNARRAIPVFERLVEIEPQRAENKKLLAIASDVANGRTPAPKSELELALLL